MKSKIYLLKYNNYYNRIVKRFDAVSEYEPYLTQAPFDNNINFKIGDGINATQILNTDIDYADYMIIEDNETKKFTRWFVLECTRLREGQYKLSLRRDVLAENINEILDSKCYIEKATLEDSDPMIYNKENFQSNQIKTSETLLYDKSGTPWIVGYFPSNIFNKEEDANDINIRTEIKYNWDYFLAEGDWTEYPYNDYFGLITYDLDNDIEYKLFNDILNENGKIVDEGDGSNIKIIVASQIETIKDGEVYHIIAKTNMQKRNIFGSSLSVNLKKYYIDEMKDSPYVMICAPYTDFLKNGNIYSDKQGFLKLFQSIATTLGSGEVYDIQILPYCPLEIKASQTPNDANFILYPYFTFTQDNFYSSDITNENENVLGKIYYCYSNNFSFSIPLNITPTNLKESNQLDTYRLCSPNYNGVFEFSPAQNNGINFINVDCTYKPFQPYIHLSPNFKNLYGNDFNDSRGLICGGDFSVDQVSNSWANYQMNNKNYQQMFDRQIQNLEFKQKLEMIDTVSGAVSGVATGAVAGSITGVGAVTGGLISAVGGATDIMTTSISHAEALDYTKDMYNYNLKNIQALPNSLSKTTCINLNSKYIPFIEYYTCTEKEREAFENKLKYNGMTVNRIDSLRNFVKSYESYMKGSIIRIDVNEDYHYVSELTSEVFKGFFIKEDLK